MRTLVLFVVFWLSALGGAQNLHAEPEGDPQEETEDQAELSLLEGKFGILARVSGQEAVVAKVQHDQSDPVATAKQLEALMEGGVGIGVRLSDSDTVPKLLDLFRRAAEFGKVNRISSDNIIIWDDRIHTDNTIMQTIKIDG